MIGQRLESRRHVYTLPEDVTAVINHVAELDAHAEVHPLVIGEVRIAGS